MNATEPENLWEEIGNECLLKALALLKSETVPTAATVESVRTLVETALAIDALNFRYDHENPVLPNIRISPALLEKLGRTRIPL